jgi:hypothetical protein
MGKPIKQVQQRHGRAWPGHLDKEGITFLIEVTGTRDCGAAR